MSARKFCTKHAPNVFANLCFECRDLNETWAEKHPTLLTTIIFFGGLALIIGARLVWAKFVYHDYRCFAAECRIQINP